MVDQPIRDLLVQFLPRGLDPGGDAGRRDLVARIVATLFRRRTQDTDPHPSVLVRRPDNPFGPPFRE